MMKVLALINPKSGENKGQLIFSIISGLLASSQLAGRALLLEPDFSLPPTAELQGYDLILICGGDGTVSSILPKLGEDAPPVCIGPLGTANDLARELGHSRKFQISRILEYLQLAHAAPRAHFQLWRAEWGPKLEHSKVFANYASLGFDARVVDKFDRWRKGSRASWLQRVKNRLAYGFLSLPETLSSIDLSQAQLIKGKEPASVSKSASSLLICNIRSYLGFAQSNQKSDPLDEVCELLVIKSPFAYLSMMLPASFSLAKPTLIGSADTWNLSSLGGQIPLQIDGEPAGLVSSKFRIIPSGTVAVVDLR